MIDLLLINPSLELTRRRDDGFVFPWVEGGHSWIPQFAVSLLPYVRRAGFTAKLLDMELHASETEDALLAQWAPQARFVGVTAMTATVPHALALTRTIRSVAPQAQIVWGGVHASLLPDQTVAEPAVDVVVVGEGEEPLVALLRGEPHERLVTMSESVKPLARRPFLAPADLPDPDFDAVEMERYFDCQGGYRNVELLTSRGCPFDCSFCVNTIMHNAWRGFDPSRTISMVRDLRDRYGMRHLFLMDENFFGKLDRAKTIIQAISEMDITWEANIHIATLLRLSDDVFNLIRDSGVVRLRMGAETASDRLLEILRKHVTVDDLARARDRCLAADITPVMSFMTDLPDEQPDEKLATLLFVEASAEAGAATIGPQSFRPYPGSEEFNKLVARGLEIPQTLAEWATCDLYTAGVSATEAEGKRRAIEAVRRRIEQGPNYDVTLRNLGKGDASRDQQIWLYYVSSEIVPFVVLTEPARQGGWDIRPAPDNPITGELIVSQQEGDSMTFRMVGDQLKLRCVAHAWAGRVAIAVNGEEVARADLFSETSNERVVCIDIPRSC